MSPPPRRCWAGTAILVQLLLLVGPALAVFECGNQETAAFVRISRARLDGTPLVVSTAGHDLTCAQYCRNNIEPTTGAQRYCASFNFDGRETCYFFDDAAAPAGLAQLNPNPSANNFYYEKTCLPGVSAHEACTYRPFSFERMRRTALEGFVKKSVQIKMGQTASTLLWGPAWKPSRQIRIENGLIQGKTFQITDTLEVDAFLGIPFGKPPVGELRFKKPLPAEPWSGVRICDQFGPRCPHEDVSIEKLTVFHPKNENCLSLNVFAPVTEQKTDDHFLPVAVFVHGGGFAVHSSAHYGDHGICKILCSKGIIVVTIQYRLGFFGFLTTGDKHCPGNWGLWDQTLALRWVQKNIRSFGGDPANVTLFGQSAGGASTDFLSLSPHSKDLFHKMVPMSGTSLCSFAINDPEYIRDMCLQFALRHGFLPPDDFDQDVQSAALVEFFRHLPSSVLEINMLGLKNDGRLDLTPCFDGDFFPKPFPDLRRALVPIPTLTGITAHEGLLFNLCIYMRLRTRTMNLSTALKPPRGSFREELRRQILIDFQKRRIHDHSLEKAVFDMYLREIKNDRHSYITACLSLISEMIIANGVWELAEMMAKKGGQVYLYSFDYFNPQGFGLAGLLFPYKGATHCSEIPFLFGKGIIANFNATNASPSDLKMIEIFSTYFTNFVKYSNPNGPPDAEQVWRPFQTENPLRYFRIDLVDSGMCDNFCNGRPLKWREILKPCSCNQRICAFPPPIKATPTDKSRRQPLIEDINNNNETTTKKGILNLDNLITRPIQNFGLH